MTVIAQPTLKKYLNMMSKRSFLLDDINSPLKQLR